MRFQDVEIDYVAKDGTMATGDDLSSCTVTFVLNYAAPREWCEYAGAVEVPSADFSLNARGERLIITGPTNKLDEGWLALAERAVSEANERFRHAHQYSIDTQELVDARVEEWDLPVV